MDSNITKNNNFIKEENLKFDENKTIIEDSLTSLGGYTNSICVFNSIDNIPYLIYTNTKNSIICYNIIDKKIINEIKKAHLKEITNYRHCLDKPNKRDLILSISAEDNALKIWNINKFELILEINKVYKFGYLFSASFLIEDKNIFIITSNCIWNNNSESIKVLDLYGYQIKEINDSKNQTLFIDSFFDSTWDKNYIITGNKGSIKSYDYYHNKLYQNYSDNDNKNHLCVIVKENKYEKIIKIFDSCYDGNIRIWDFHSGQLLQKIEVTNKNLYGFCLWDDENILVGCEDKTIKIINIKNCNSINFLFGHIIRVVSVKNLVIPKYGKFLISQGAERDNIILWKNNN